MKLLITGGSGFLGNRILSAFSHTDTCIAPSHSELDITDSAQCLDAMQRWQPDIVIHTAAISDVRRCESNPKLSRAANVVGPSNLAAACKRTGSRLIFMSSDQVYAANHTSSPNTESDPCRPPSLYGRQKWEAEQRILDLLPQDAVCLRLSWMYDLPTPDRDTKPNFLTQILAASETSPVSFSDLEYRGITWVWEVIQNLRPAFSLPAGIYNFGSPAADTTYRLAANVFSLLGKDADRERLLQTREGVSPRSLAMTQHKLQAHHIFFSENLDGIRACLNFYQK